MLSFKNLSCTCASLPSCRFWKVSLLPCLHYTHTQNTFSPLVLSELTTSGNPTRTYTCTLSLSLLHTQTHNSYPVALSELTTRCTPTCNHTYAHSRSFSHTHKLPTRALSTHSTQPPNTHLHTHTLSLSYTHIHTIFIQWRSRNSQHAAHSWTWRTLAVRQGMPTSRP